MEIISYKRLPPIYEDYFKYSLKVELKNGSIIYDYLYSDEELSSDDNFDLIRYFADNYGTVKNIDITKLQNRIRYDQLL